MIDARVGKRANSGEYRLCGVARRSVGALVNRHPPDSRVVERDCPPDRGALQRNSIGADPLAPGSSRCPPQQRRNSWLCLDRGAILPSSSVAFDPIHPVMREPAAAEAGRERQDFREHLS